LGGDGVLGWVGLVRVRKKSLKQFVELFRSNI
jgi:hypothetical protein